MNKENILLLVLIFICTKTTAQVNPNLYDIPTAENVLANIKGTDNIDTYAKQRAALYVLWDIAMSEMEKDYQFTEKPIKKVIFNQKLEYNNAMRSVYEKYLKEINRPENEEVKDNWRKLWVGYKYNTVGFKENIIENLFNDRAKKRYFELNGHPKKEVAYNQSETGENQQSSENHDTNNFSSLEKAEAAYRLGKKLISGHEEEQSFEKAFLYFKDAIKFGSHKALFFVGYMYSKGWGVVQDYNEAQKYYKLAEKYSIENAKAFYDLAFLYYNGKMAEHNYQLIYGFLLKSSDIGNSDADVLLGIMNYKGQYVTKDYNTAFEYFKKAADQSNAYGLYYTGLMYVTDNVVNGDFSEALPYYLVLAKKGIVTLGRESRSYVLNTILEIYTAQNKKKEALEFSQWARLNRPDDIDAKFILNEANVYFSIDNKEKYMVLMEEAADLEPNNVLVHYNMGVINMEMGNVEQARTNYSKALAIDSGYYNARLNLSATYVNEGNELIEEMNSLGNTQVDIAHYDELKLRKDGLFREGAKVLEEALKYNWESKELLSQLKNIYGALGDTDNFDRINKLLLNK